MNEENPKPFLQGPVYPQEYDSVGCSGKPDAQYVEENNFRVKNEIKTSDEAICEKTSLASVKNSSVLLNDKEKDSNFLLEKISIKPSVIKTSTSLTDFCNLDLSNYQTSLSDMDLPQNKYLQVSASQSMLQIDCSKRYSSSERYQDCDIDNVETIANDTELLKSDRQFVAPTDLLEDVAKCKETCSIYEDKKSSAPSAGDLRSHSNLTSRPTLADDSRLVKISLPTNPMNIMQSNTQLMNKGRNFLNFVTEKSINIMEKALLPQHLTTKYNSMLKSVDTTCTEKKCAEEASPRRGESSLTDSTSSESIFKGNDGSQLINVSGTVKAERDDWQVQTRFADQNRTVEESVAGKVHQQTEPQANLTSNILLTDNGIGSFDDQTLEELSARITAKADGNVTFSEMNGDSKVYFDDVRSSSTGDTSNCPSERTSEIGKERREELPSTSDSSNLGLLQHPAYLTLLKDYACLKTNSLKLQERIESLEERNRTLETEKRGEMFAQQIGVLEKTIERLTSELHSSFAAHETLKKRYNAANKERESMIMKYAVSEKQLIVAQRAKECAESKVDEIAKELSQCKTRHLQEERTKIHNSLDGKCREVADLQKEVEKLREDVKLRDVKLKWTQTKLKTEMDFAKEMQQKFEEATARVNEMKEECDQVRREAQESMRKFQQSEENKAVTLDQQLKEQQARLILERHVTEDKEMLRLQLQKEVDVLQKRQQVLIEENNTLSLKIQDSEKSRLNYESSLGNLKVIADQRQKEIADLLGRVSEIETLKVHLQHKNQCLASAESEIQHLRSANEELQSDMAACRQREANMLDFTQKLTDKNVRLQSEFTTIETKAKQLQEEHGPLHEKISGLKSQIKSLEESLAKEQRTRSEECEILARHLAEQTQLAENFSQKLEDSQGENAVLKRKQQISVKEMTRELQQCRKRLEAFEAASPCNSLGVTSRTGSNMSLNAGDALNGALSDNSTNGEVSIQTAEPSRQVLIDRILKLQKTNVKYAEKLDFLGEHTQTLLEELQQKKRIIQNYVLNGNFGAMGSNERDRFKHIKGRRNFAEVAKHGGIMSSLYNQQVSDDNMTFELSLEMNKKQQIALEDALSENITLKKSIDTLGEEIDRLRMQNQQRQITSS